MRKTVFNVKKNWRELKTKLHKKNYLSIFLSIFLSRKAKHISDLLNVLNFSNIILYPTLFSSSSSTPSFEFFILIDFHYMVTSELFDRSTVVFI